MNIRKKQIIMLSLGVLLLMMAVGYAAVYTTLYVTGTASLEATWDVGITAISEGTPTGTAYNKSTPTYTGTNATFDVGFKNAGDSMEYEVTITNNGSLDAIVKDLSASAFYNNYSTPDDNIEVLTYGNEVYYGSLLKSGESKILKVKVEIPEYLNIFEKENEINEVYRINVNINFEQYTNQKYTTRNFSTNERILLEDGHVWRVTSQSVYDDKSIITLIREKPLSEELLFDDNGGTDFKNSTLKTYLNNTYKNTLPESITKNLIGDISIPSVRVKTNTSVNNSMFVLSDVYKWMGGTKQSLSDSVTRFSVHGIYLLNEESDSFTYNNLTYDMNVVIGYSSTHGDNYQDVCIPINTSEPYEYGVQIDGVCMVVPRTTNEIEFIPLTHIGYAKVYPTITLNRSAIK